MAEQKTKRPPARSRALKRVVAGVVAVEERPDERLVERAVAELRDLVVGGQVELMTGVGEYVIRNFYIDEAALRSHTPRKAASLARVAERAEEFGMTPSGVKRAVAVAAQARVLGRSLARRLRVSHHEALLPVRDAQEKKLLAEAAADGGWTLDKLRSRVRRLQKPHQGGRPPAPAVQRVVERTARLLGTATPEHLQQGYDDMSPADAGRLLGQVNALQATLERIEKMLQRRATRREGG